MFRILINENRLLQNCVDVRFQIGWEVVGNKNTISANHKIKQGAKHASYRRRRRRPYEPQQNGTIRLADATTLIVWGNRRRIEKSQMVGNNF